MPVSTVNISFQDDFLSQIDQIAVNEARSRSELIREAIRLYIERKMEFNQILNVGKKIGSTLNIKEKDVMKEIKKNRKIKQKVK